MQRSLPHCKTVVQKNVVGTVKTSSSSMSCSSLSTFQPPAYRNKLLQHTMDFRSTRDQSDTLVLPYSRIRSTRDQSDTLVLPYSRIRSTQDQSDTLVLPYLCATQLLLVSTTSHKRPVTKQLRIWLRAKFKFHHLLHR